MRVSETEFIYISDVIQYQKALQEISTLLSLLHILPGRVNQISEKVSHSDRLIVDCWMRNLKSILNKFACVLRFVFFHTTLLSQTTDFIYWLFISHEHITSLLQKKKKMQCINCQIYLNAFNCSEMNNKC